MKLKFVLTIVLFCLITEYAWGQDEKFKFIYFDTGIDFISCASPDKDYIRADLDPYMFDYISENIRSLMFLEYYGVKFEYRKPGHLFGFTGGLHYTRMNSSIGKNTYYSGTTDFFYVQYNQIGTTTEYARVRALNQRSGYLGIPLELRIYPYKDRKVSVFYKAGASFNVNVSSRSDIDFSDSMMDAFRNEVAKVIESASPFYSTFNLGVGLRIGKSDKPGFTVEASFPVGVLTPDRTSFVTPEMGGGLQFNVRIPLK